MNMKKKVMPPTVFYFFIILILLVDFLFPSGTIHLKFSGVFLMILGLVFDIGAWMQFKRKTTLNPFKMPSKFETRGFYRISRNPQYLGMDLFLWGLCLFVNSFISFIFPIIFIIIIDKFYIKHEEENMKKAFGKKYLEYKKRTRSWI